MTLASFTAAGYVTCFMFVVKMYPSVNMTVSFYLADPLVHYFKWLTDCSGKINSNFKKTFNWCLLNHVILPHGHMVVVILHEKRQICVIFSILILFLNIR